MLKMYYSRFDSPIGYLTISTDGMSVTELHIEGDRYFTSIPKNWKNDNNNQLLITTQNQVTEYLNGERKVFSIPILYHGTPFQELVWKELEKIPFGGFISYKLLAEKIGKPNSARAVGTAVGRNPLCILIPCQRVVASDGSLGGYVAGLEKKQKLLKLEKIILS